MIVARADKDIDKVRRSEAVRDVAAALREHGVLISFCAFYILVSFGVAVSNDLSHLYSLSLYPTSGLPALVVSGLVFALGYVIWLALIEKEKKPLNRLRSLAKFLSSWRGPLRIALPIVIVGLVGSAYTSMKGMIPLLYPFAFDVDFAEFDRALHFGVDPWQLTHAVFGSIKATLTINFVYSKLWFLVSWGFLLWQILNLGQPQQRMRFLLAFAMLWALLGSLGATMLSSAGPVYYGYVTGLESPFAALMERLYAMSNEIEAAGGSKISALRAQEWLWGTYQDSGTEVGSGISAMPSMHVAMAVLVALSGRLIGKIAGWVLIIYAVIMQIGSVHLGWHYAIDGYLSVILTILVWKLAGVIVERTLPTELRGPGAA